jgi:12,18-didecarboxysiroheme deacetylase
MIGISKLYCGTVEASDAMRYGRQSASLPSHLLQFSADKKPVLVWNCTKRCNLRCVHCYSTSTCEAGPDELTGDEARRMIDDLGRFGCPVLLLSGGEPLMRPDVLELIAAAKSAGLRAVLSTNGTLIDEELAGKLSAAGLSYVGVSLDGLETVHDAFRGVPGAFRRALRGIRACVAAGVKVGLRMTVNRRNVEHIGGVLDLLEREAIPRVCFYHLVYTGRGDGLRSDTLSHAETRSALDLIMDRTAALHARGRKVEVLTVDNHADGPYVYLRLLREDPRRAAECLKLLEMNAGNSTGLGIGCVSWNGDVLPDQFWRHHVLGNVRRRPFSEVWSDGASGDGLLGLLRDRKNHMKCRCTRCRWLGVCNGNFRARAEAVSGDLWGDDPACYLTDEEIAGESANAL